MARRRITSFDGIITGSSNKWVRPGCHRLGWLYPAGVYGCGQVAFRPRQGRAGELHHPGTSASRCWIPTAPVTEEDFLAMSSSEKDPVMSNNPTGLTWTPSPATSSGRDPGNPPGKSGPGPGSPPVRGQVHGRQRQQRSDQRAGVSRLPTPARWWQTPTACLWQMRLAPGTSPTRRAARELESIQVRVRLSDQDLVDLSQAVEFAKELPEAAKAAAEAAQEKAETAQEAAEAARRRQCSLRKLPERPPRGWYRDAAEAAGQGPGGRREGRSCREGCRDSPGRGQRPPRMLPRSRDAAR